MVYGIVEHAVIKPLRPMVKVLIFGCSTIQLVNGNGMCVLLFSH